MKNNLLVLAAIAVLALTACTTNSTYPNTNSVLLVPVPTHKPVATATPTATPTDEPEPTPKPSHSPKPTPTPCPTETPDGE